MVPATSPKVTASSAAAGAAVVVLWIVQQTDLADETTGVVGLIVTTLIGMLGTFAAGWGKTDTNPAPSAEQTLISRGWQPPT